MTTSAAFSGEARDFLRELPSQVRWAQSFPGDADGVEFAPWCAKQLMRCADVHRWLVTNL